MDTITFEVEDELKEKSEQLFEELGLDMNTAIDLFLRQAILCGGIPFEIRKPNAETLAAIEEVEKIKRGEIKAKKYNSFAELVKELEEEIEQEAKENV